MSNHSTNVDAIKVAPITATPVSIGSRTLAGLALMLLLCGAAGLAHAGNICRVTTAGVPSNSGASWSQPKDLMSAIGSYTCSEVWVEQGVYFADQYPYRFNIQSKTSFKLLGGFAGTEGSAIQRKPADNLTVLSGDKMRDDINIDGNFIDENVSNIQGDNSHNVVWLQSTFSFPITHAVVIDGFTITGGDTRAISGNGGGLICQGSGQDQNQVSNECSPTLSHLVFVGNIATRGGGMYLNGGQNGISAPIISDVVFDHNKAGGGTGQSYGGGLMCNAQSHGTCTPTLTNVIFSYNDAGSYYGGGMFNDAQYNGNASPTLNNVTFDHNSAGYQGGGMMNYGYGGTSSPILFDVTFSNNSANDGAAMFNLGQLDPGQNPGTSAPILHNVTFSNNSADHSGGAMYNWGAHSGNINLSLTNVTFSNNRAGINGSGGAIYNTANTSGRIRSTLTNVLLWGNTAGVSGNNIFIDDTLYANTGLTINHSLVEGSDASIAYGTNAASTAFIDGILNFDDDPLLGALGDHGGFTQTQVPGFTGAAVDNGTCTVAPTIDQRGVTRPTGNGCDIGAVEATEPLPDLIFKDGFD